MLVGAEFTPSLPMEVKTILGKIRQKENQSPDYYFALEISLDFVKSGIFSIEESQVKVLSFGDKERWGGEEELIEAIDASLSSAAEKLTVEGEVKEPDQVIFGLPFDWIEGDKIVGDKLKLLKKLSEKLSLKPAGFVVNSEAIIHHLKATEGIPPTAILVNLGLKKIIVSLVRVGKLSGPKLIDRSDDLANDLIEGLSRFEVKEPLPARILLYDGDEKLEEVKQQLVSHPWLEKKKEGVEFLHLPKVEVLPSDSDVEAISLAGGEEVAKAAGLVIKEKLAKARPVPAELAEDKAKKKAEEEVEEKPALAKALADKEPGFVAAGEMGFVKGKDVVEEPAVTEAPAEKKEPEKDEERPVEERVPVEKKPSVFAKTSPIQSALFWLKKIKLTSLKDLISRFRQRPSVPALVGGFFLILIIVLLAVYWYFPRAEIVLYLEPEVLEKEFTIVLDPSASAPDKENFILPAEKVEVEIEETKSRGTTGTKDTGDPAQGEVTVYNGTSNEKTFESGAVITSSGGLEFTLDDDVTVASQSSAADPPGKAVVKTTAVEVGTEGNLASGAEFTIANYAKSDYVARNDSAFSGGTSRQIQIVSKEDREALLADLEVSLEEKAKNQLLAQLSLEQKLVEESITSQLTDKDYSHQLGDETDSLELTLKLKSSALIYTEEELRDLIEDKVTESISEGFEYDPEETEFSFDLGEVDEDGRVTFETHLNVNLTPQLDLEQIKRNLAGKQLVIGKAYLSNLPKVIGFEATVTPQLPGRLGTFPRITKRIEIKSEIQ